MEKLRDEAAVKNHKDAKLEKITFKLGQTQHRDTDYCRIFWK